MLVSEDSLGTKRIDEWFSPDFFQTTFWWMRCTTFAFQPWHSLAEFKRYLHRFIHEFTKIHNLANIWRTPYNQYDSITLPVETWLKEQGVHFKTHTEVTDLDFKPTPYEKLLSRYITRKKGKLVTLILIKKI